MPMTDILPTRGTSKTAYWRLIVWNATIRAGYAILHGDGSLSFTQNWRDATALPTKEAWDAARTRVVAMGPEWSSTPLNAPRRAQAVIE